MNRQHGAAERPSQGHVTDPVNLCTPASPPRCSTGPIERGHAAADQLATWTQPAGETRLAVADDTLTLTVAPRMRDTAARLSRTPQPGYYTHDIGPDPTVMHLIYQLSEPYYPGRTRHDRLPNLVDEASTYRLVTCEIDPQFGLCGSGQ